MRISKLIKDEMEGILTDFEDFARTHTEAGTHMDVAADHAGVNSNVLTDELEVDPLSGNAVLSGIPVELEPAVPAGEHQPVTAGAA